MSVTKYMHPRNIYKNPPNFRQLAIDYPEFRKHVQQDLSGKVTIDFKDVEALRALTCTLLEKDFGLRLEIPITKLIPTVPLRLNYLLWIEDLLSIKADISASDTITGLDIGTGASCVYPLLAAKKYAWHMIGTEINDESRQIATNNVRSNQLEDRIELFKPDNDTLLLCVLQSRLGANIDFSICNPPFFASTQQLSFEFKSRTANRPRPKNAFVAAASEVVVDGGEVAFVSKMIRESKELGQQIRIYTSMIGHKTSLAPLKRVLRDADVISFKQTRFCQGNTTRWGLAWTYCDIDLRTPPADTVTAGRAERRRASLSGPPSKTLELLVNTRSGEEDSVTLDVLADAVAVVLNKLQIDFKPVQKCSSATYTTYHIRAAHNTWSHQRRKRREQQRITGGNTAKFHQSVSVNHVKPCDVVTAADQLSDMRVASAVGNNNIVSSSLSRKHLRDDEGCDVDGEVVDSVANSSSELDSSAESAMVVEEDDSGFYKHKRVKLMSEKDNDENGGDVVVLEGDVIVSVPEEGGGKVARMEMLFHGGSGGKDAVNQVLQYFKNNLKL